ncbi:outer membrane protein assembly factor BamB family protein [Oerskovia turbata]
MRTMAFEEVLDDEPAPSAGTPDGPPAPGGADSVDRIPPLAAASPRAARARRRWVVAGVVVLVVVGGLALGGEIEERRTTERLSAARGGLVPWGAAPPRELWSLDVPGGRFVSGGAAGLLLVDGAEVSRIDLETGLADWSHEVGAGATCGTDHFWSESVDQDDPLVCVSAGTDRIATVLDADGAVLGELVLDDLGGEGAVVSPGPSGSVIVAERTGEPDADAPATTYELPTALGGVEDVVVPAGRGVRLRVVDVATGDERWGRDVEFVADEEYPSDCVSSDITGEDAGEGLAGEESFSVDTDNLLAGAAMGMVQVSGCGVSSLFSADGTLLQAPGSPSGARLPDGSGGFLSFDGQGETATAFDASGRVLWESPGMHLFPGATDDAGAGARILAVSGQVVAVDAGDGRPLWTADVTPDSLLAQTSEVVVVSSLRKWIGLDALTGRTLWESTPTNSDHGFYGTFTDGKQLLVSSPVAGSSTGGAVLTAYDLLTGEELWTLDGLSEEEQFVAHDGALLRVGEGSLSRWG